MKWGSGQAAGQPAREACWPGSKARVIRAGGDHVLQAQEPWAFRTRFSSPPHFHPGGCGSCFKKTKTNYDDIEEVWK